MTKSSETVGQRIAHYRKDAALTFSQLAKATGLSKSYLSELESGRGSAQKPSAETLYAIARALGVTMADLLGKPVLVQHDEEPPESLLRFAKQQHLPQSDIRMLASIQFRGEKPKTPERWAFIYQAIKSSASMER
jgi:transcriptional regulator with XRE-family HTH domain